MSDLFYLAILPALATGVVFLLVVTGAGWIGYRFFGYLPKGYEDRLQSDEHAAAAGRQKTKPAIEATTTTAQIASLRTPLTTIIGFSELLCHQSARQLEPAAVVEYARQIHVAAHQVLGQVDALAAAKTGTGEPEKSELQSKGNHLKRALQA